MTWLAPTSLNGTSEYRVSTTSGTQVCRTTTLTCTVTGLRNGSRYSFTVRAVNAVGPRPVERAQRGSRPRLCSGSGPSSEGDLPQGRQGSPHVDRSRQVGGLAVTSYQVRRRAASANAWGPWVSTALTRAKPLKGLVRGRAYVVQIRAVNLAGPGAPVARRILSNR